MMVRGAWALLTHDRFLLEIFRYCFRPCSSLPVELQISDTIHTLYENFILHSIKSNLYSVYICVIENTCRNKSVSLIFKSLSTLYFILSYFSNLISVLLLIFIFMIITINLTRKILWYFNEFAIDLTLHSLPTSAYITSLKLIWYSSRSDDDEWPKSFFFSCFLKADQLIGLINWRWRFRRPRKLHIDHWK